MELLMITQTGPQGHIKSWKITQVDRVLTLGQSKHADLRIPMALLKGIQGAFEYRQGHWYYINMDLEMELQNGEEELCINAPCSVTFGDYQLNFRPLPRKEHLFSFSSEELLGQAMPEGSAIPSASVQPYQIFTVHAQDLLLETRLFPLRRTSSNQIEAPRQGFTSRFDVEHRRVDMVIAKDWKIQDLGFLRVSQKTIHLSDVSRLRSIREDKGMDIGGKRTLVITFLVAGLLALIFLLSPSTRDAGEMAKMSVQPLAYREVKMELPKKKRVPRKPQEPTAAAASSTTAASHGPPPKGLSAIQSLGGSRISQLLGKISATSARSKNVVVVQNGISANTNTPSGGALSALGKINQSGKDWTRDANGADVKISGLMGGKGVGGMGKLGTGKTGSGGMQLLEDESEVVGGLDREVIAQYIKTQLGQILYCYERQLSANPGLYGKVSVKFTIGPTGQVISQNVSETTLKSTPVETCILQKVRSWVFQKPSNGTQVVVTYPFLFKST